MNGIVSRNVVRISAVAASMVLAIGVLGACSSESGASSADKSPASSGSPAGSSKLSFSDWQVKYRECLMDNGVELPDVGGGGPVDMSKFPENFEEIANTCKTKIGEPPMDEGASVPSVDEMKELGYKTAQCLRGKGYDVNDPTESDTLGVAGKDIPQDAITECLNQANSSK